MKLQLSRKWLYGIAVGVIVALIALLLYLSACEKANQSAPDAPKSTRSPIQEAESKSDAGRMSTVAYYQDDNGYLVPVMREIPKEQGVAKATLSLMVKSVYNDMEAARLGLRCVIPENTAVDLDVSNGKARIDLSREALNSPDAVSEYNMVHAIVQALTDFPTVDSVKILIEGKEEKTLPFGTDISGEFQKGYMNLEGGLNGGTSAVTLYFTGESPQMIVPVTRMIYGSGDINTAVLELVKGPSELSPLNGVIPSGCGLLGVEVRNKVAYVNFTKEFIDIARQTDGGRLALRALVLTCLQFDGVDSVCVQVEGKTYDTGEGTLTAPTFVNSATDIQDAFIRERSVEIFEFE